MNIPTDPAALAWLRRAIATVARDEPVPSEIAAFYRSAGELLDRLTRSQDRSRVGRSGHKSTRAATPRDSGRGMRTQEPGPRLLRARDAAGLLHISESTIRRLTRTGHIKPIRIGRSVRYHPDELARYLERNQRAA